jgi:hypothetical protein
MFFSLAFGRLRATAVSTVVEESKVMTPDEIRTLVLARCSELTGEDLDMLNAETGEEMIPVSVLSQVVEVVEMLEARMIALEANAQDGELDAVA